jgi:hypothetical protein
LNAPLSQHAKHDSNAASLQPALPSFVRAREPATLTSDVHSPSRFRLAENAIQSAAAALVSAGTSGAPSFQPVVCSRWRSPCVRLVVARI